MKRRFAKARTAGRVTDAAVAAFIAGDWLGLHRALGLQPWQANPLDVDAGPPPAGYDADAWAAAQALRRELRERSRLKERQP